MTDAITPAQLARDGKTAFEKQDYPQAAAAFQAAENGFRASGDDLNAAEMANNRSVALLQNDDSQAALEAVMGTAEIFAESGDRKRQALSLGNQAAALGALGRKEEAEKLYWEAAQILKELGEDDMRASVLQSISRLQMGSGRYMEAIASMESGIEGIQKPSLTQRMLKKLLSIPGKLMNR